MRLSSGLLAGLIGALAAPAAQAAVVDYNFGFTARDFIPAQGSVPAPVDPVVGRVSVSLDPAVSYTDATSGVSVSSLNIGIGSPISFSYDPSIGVLLLGGSQNGTSIFPDTNDFLLGVANMSANPTFDSFIYAQTGSVVYFTSSGEIGEIAPIPLPPAILLMGSALAGLAGLGLRSRSRVVAPRAIVPV